MHEFLIFYSHTEWDSPFAESEIVPVFAEASPMKNYTIIIIIIIIKKGRQCKAERG